MNAYSYIKNKVNVHLKPSSISGIGVFALENITEGENLFQPWLGETGFYPISNSEMESFSKEKRVHIRDLFLYGPNFPKDSSTYVYLVHGCHWVYTTPYYFVNSGGSNFNLDKDTLSTVRTIKKGEEVLSNYGRYERNKRLL